jgi:hypothetical protein
MWKKRGLLGEESSNNFRKAEAWMFFKEMF